MIAPENGLNTESMISRKQNPELVLCGVCHACEVMLLTYIVLLLHCEQLKSVQQCIIVCLCYGTMLKKRKNAIPPKMRFLRIKDPESKTPTILLLLCYMFASCYLYTCKYIVNT